MKILYSTVLCLLLIVGNITAQEESILIDAKFDIEKLDCNNYFQRDLAKKLYSKFKDNIVKSSNPNYIIGISYGDVKVNFLEGLETYHFATTEVQVELSNNFNSNKISFQLKGEGKASDACRAKKSAVKKAFAGKGKSTFIEKLEEYHNDQLSNYCSDIESKAEKFNTAGEYKDALYLLQKIDSESPCFEKLTALRSKVEESIAVEACETEMHELQLVVNTKDIRLIRKNIYRLLRIPVDAPCSTEALALSKEIGDIFQSENLTAPKDLNQFQVIIQSKDSQSWRNNYLRN